LPDIRAKIIGEKPYRLVIETIEVVLVYDDSVNRLEFSNDATAGNHLLVVDNRSSSNPDSCEGYGQDNNDHMAALSLMALLK